MDKGSIPVALIEQREREGARSQTPAAGRLVALDALRAVAVFLVIGQHLPRSAVKPEAGWSDTTLALLRTWRLGGWIGVDVFFVLSGFLVSGLLFREYQRHGELRIGQFLIRRGLKIYPAFYLMIALTVAAGCSFEWSELLGELFFIQNTGLFIWEPTWSLAIEEQFYLLLSGYLWYLIRHRQSTTPFANLPQTILGLSLFCLLLRIAHAALFDFSYLSHHMPTALRIDSLAFGVLLAYAFHADPNAYLARCRRHRKTLLMVGCLLLTPPFLVPLRESPWLFTFGYSQLAVGSGMLLLGLLSLPERRSWVLRSFARVGVYSYSIYLWHYPWLKLLESFALSPKLLLAVYFVGSLVIGIAMSKLIELPVLRLRDRVFPSRSGLIASRTPSSPAQRTGLVADPL